MQVKLQIKAYFLLGLFSLLLLHQTIPHIHHEHQENGQGLTAHSHEHQHEKEPEDPKDFLSFLMAMHSHGSSSTEVPVVREITQHIILEEPINESTSPQNFLLKRNLSEDPLAKLSPNFEPPPKYLHFYLVILSLRGPPGLV